MSFPGLAQERQVPWSSERLGWEDFEGPVNASSSFSANTSSGVSYGWSLTHGGNEAPEFKYQVSAFFVPERSWVKAGKKDPHLLTHEQLHFDISELHARKLRQELQDFDPASVRDVKAALQKIYSRIEMQRKQMQEQFDRETAHSQNVEAQLKWEQRILHELELTEEFSLQ